MGHAASLNHLITGVLVHQQRKSRLNGTEDCYANTSGSRFSNLTSACNAVFFLQATLPEVQLTL